MSTPDEMRAGVASILFGPADDGYIMLSLRSETGERLVAAGRAIPAGVQTGDELTMTGKWAETKRGPVFQVRTARKDLPRSADGIRKWLAKAKVPGIGSIKADRLVDRFGLETIDALCEEREGVADIVGRKQTPKSAEAVRGRRREAEIGATLSRPEYAIGARTQRKILDKYGDRTHDVLSNEPYRLIIEIEGVAFATADKIARAAGLAENAPARIQAGIIDGLRQASLDGHCALYHQLLVERCRQALYVAEREVEAQLAEMAGKRLVETEVRGMRAWALKTINRTERDFARSLVRKINDGSVRNFGVAAVTQAVDEAQATLGMKLSDEQREGAIMALTQRISILTGGPGTGKTLVLRVICEAWRQLARRISVRTEEQRLFALAAPTGKAAKRITETTGFEGRTMHRLLEYKPDTNDYDRNAMNPLLEGMICIDEASMPDIAMMSRLGQAWGQARVLLIGDTDQLPSVGPGKVLADMLESAKVPHTRLTRIYRQAAGSDIAIGAERMRHGDVPMFGDPGTSDLVHIEIADAERAADRIVGMYVNRLPIYAERNGLDPTSVQILCPGHQTEVGTIALNRAIQAALHGGNGDRPQVSLSDKTTAGPGDKVIQLENDYDKNIYNGDTGTIVEIDRTATGQSTTHVDFGGRIVSFQGATLTNLGLAYALSIHKSQGSEFQIVVIPVTTSHYTMLRRTLLYTGITRAKRLCIVVGTAKAIRRAVSQEDSATRITTLRDAILEECEAMDEPRDSGRIAGTRQRAEPEKYGATEEKG